MSFRTVRRLLVTLVSALTLLGAAGGYLTHIDQPYETYEGD